MLVFCIYVKYRYGSLSSDMQQLENFCFPFNLWYHPWEHSKLQNMWGPVQNKTVGSFIQVTNSKMATTKHVFLPIPGPCVTAQAADSWSQPHMGPPPKLAFVLLIELQKTWRVVTKASLLVSSINGKSPSHWVHPYLFICYIKMNRLLKTWQPG